ncbi:MAG: endo-1,4-beta-xylanase [Chlorobi bacterium]|nr:endo-1,4-beta-xylanase [Chlorobiota bacterium]
MGRILFFKIALIGFAITIITSCDKQTAFTGVDKEFTLRYLSTKNNHFMIGSLFNYKYVYDVSDHEKFEKTLSDEFNIISGEWELEAESIWIGLNSYNFKYADALLKFAQDNNMKVKWTHLLWHGALPEWQGFQSLSDVEFETAVHNYIDTVMHHCKVYFPGVVHDYNVVNEVIDPNEETTFRPTVFVEKMGNDFVEKAFTWAHEADPDAKLYICDYDFLGNPVDNQSKQDLMYALVSDLVNKGIPIHGIAEQAHLNTEYIDDIDYYTPQDMNYWSETMDLYADLGLKFEVSEMTIAINEDGKGVNSERLDRQAEICKEIIELCLTKPYVEAVIFWGLTDKYTYLGSNEFPVLFDENYAPKPMYYSIYNTLQ